MLMQPLLGGHHVDFHGRAYFQSSDPLRLMKHERLQFVHVRRLVCFLTARVVSMAFRRYPSGVLFGVRALQYI